MADPELTWDPSTPTHSITHITYTHGEAQVRLGQGKTVYTTGKKISTVKG